MYPPMISDLSVQCPFEIELMYVLCTTGECLGENKNVLEIGKNE